ncbi:nucleotidyltransferase [Myroides odoratus]|uniref:nucleotidyltransferase n=1 Tax=Myroides odoratus TaxID=256 RepID=UPI0039AFAAF2
MRNREEIKTVMTDAFQENEVVIEKYGLDTNKSFAQQFSKVSLENLLFDLIAFSIWILEGIFDKHKSEVDVALAELKPGTSKWYRRKALDFQFGVKLLEDSDQFDTKDLTAEQIEHSKIIKYAAVVDADTESRLIVKIATEKEKELTPITESELEAFRAYFSEIKYAGVPITVINYEPDILQLSIRIFRDPLVINENGMSILTGKYPIQEAISEFMKELPFNGELILQDLANKVEQAEGVKIVQIDAAQSKWIDPLVGGYGEFTGIDVKRLPISGYFKVESFSGIRYVV